MGIIGSLLNITSPCDDIKRNPATRSETTAVDSPDPRKDGVWLTYGSFGLRRLAVGGTCEPYGRQTQQRKED